MKTLLIVEDEKMIRQGLHVMIKRSGVPVENILECSNGVQALQILKEQEVDVVFTDIRMPKMDGIELVNRIQELAKKPIIAAISGYDDFSFAVEMLRNGVREYILKPVERQKVLEILKKFDDEISQREKTELMDLKIGKVQLKHLLTAEVHPKETALIQEKYEKDFFPEGYHICVASKEFYLEETLHTLFMDDLLDGNVCVIPPKDLPLISENELWKEYAGISRHYEDLGELHEAYLEAMAARKRAFCAMKIVDSSVPDSKIPPQLRKESLKGMEEAAWMKRIQLIGSEREEEMEKSWNQLFSDVQKERILPSEFEAGMLDFLDELQTIYKKLMSKEQIAVCEKCRNIYAFASLEDYHQELLSLIYALHHQIQEENHSGKNQQKIRVALKYIQEHYNEDLNMAVVSNYVSMNYSLFSYELKQYTGTSFVNYLKAIRMEEAKKLLRDTDLKVMEISTRVGYENEKHFMKTFKALCGVSPGEYRKLMSYQSL